MKSLGQERKIIVWIRTGLSAAFVVASMRFLQIELVIQRADAAPLQENLEPDNLRSQRLLWKMVMKDLGPYSRARKCWNYNRNGKTFCIRPMKYASVDVGMKTYHLFVVSEDATSTDSFMSNDLAGPTIFIRYASSLNGSDLMREDVSEVFELGASHGNPDENAYELLKIGPSSYAWKVEFGFTNTGEETSDVTMFYAVGQEGERQRKIAHFISSDSNESGCFEKQNDCYRREIIWSLSEPVINNAYSFQMHLKERIGGPGIFSGQKPIKEYSSKSVIFSYSDTKGSYDMPGDLDTNLIDWFMRQRKIHD